MGYKPPCQASWGFELWALPFGSKFHEPLLAGIYNLLLIMIIKILACWFCVNLYKGKGVHYIIIKNSFVLIQMSYSNYVHVFNSLKMINS